MARRRLTSSIDTLDLDPPPTWSPSPLRRVLRRPVTYWVAAGLLALTSVLVIQEITADARSLQASYGDTTAVLVTTEPVAPGDELDTLTRFQEVPVGLVPDSALAEIEPGQTAAMPITRGSIVTAPQVVDSTRLAGHETAVAIPRGPLTPPLVPGQSVLIVINADPFVGVETQMIDAWVMSSGETQVIAVLGRADLTVASAALQSGVVTLALTG